MDADLPAPPIDVTLYETALQHAANAIALCEAVCDAEGAVVDFRYLLVNRSYEAFTGRPAAVTQGQLATALPDAFPAGIWHRAADVFGSGQLHHEELWATTSEGHAGWFDLTISRWGDRGVVLSVLEVSDQKARTLTEQRQPELLQQVISNSLNGIFVLQSIRDDAGRIVDFRFLLANQAASRINGRMTTEQFTQSSFLTLFPSTRYIPLPGSETARRPRSIFASYVDIVATGESLIYDVYYPHDGLSGWYWIAASKLNDGLIVTFLDVSNLKQTQRQLERMVSELRQTNQNLEQFAYVASHDLQEPLRKITAFGDLLTDRLDQHASQEVRDIVKRMQNSAQRMQELVKDLLVYSRLTARRDGFGLVVLNDVLREAIADLQPLIEQQRARIDCAALPTVPGHAAQLQQLFFCLLNNALKFQPVGSVPEVLISTAEEPADERPAALATTGQRFVTVSVRDNGIGFDEKYLDRIFVIFQRLHGRSRYSGTGIGLAIALKVAENHGGAITARSTPGQGSTFTVWLPLN